MGNFVSVERKSTFLLGILKIGQVDAFHGFFYPWEEMSMEFPAPAAPEINTSDLSLFNTGVQSVRMPLASQIMVKKEPA